MKQWHLILLILSSLIVTPPAYTVQAEIIPVVEPQLYDPVFQPLNVKEQMTISPMFTPDNALDIHVAWIERANSTIDVQNQYLTQFDDAVSWANDPSPIVRALVDAHNRGVTLRVQVNDDDSDNIAAYFSGLGINIRYMPNSLTGGASYLSRTHNKLVMIDDKVTLLSSINFGENAFTNNREAGMVIQSATVATYYKSIFNADFVNGEIPAINQDNTPVISSINIPRENQVQGNYPSHTNIPRSNFTGVYNVTAFTNPDNADEVIFKSLKSAKHSIYVSMYTISRPEFTNTLVDLKKANPSIDIQVLISNRRVGGSENVDTREAATTLVENLIPVYNSTKDTDKVNGFYHNKYWIIDGKTTFVYSGNWSPRSVTPQIPDGETYTSGEGNRDMGIAVHDATDIASFFKSVWDQDVAVADAWELPIGIKQNSFTTAEVVDGTVTLSATISGLNATKASYRFGSSSFTEIALDTGSFSVSLDTTEIDNGITTFEVKVDDFQVFTDSVVVNVVNAKDWRVLITEIHSNPDIVSDTLGEFFEITNSFPFDVLLEGWQAGDDKALHTFSDDYKISAYSSLIFARDLSGFSGAFSVDADIELGFSLVNGGDLIQFLDQAGSYVDVVAYGDASAADGSETVAAPDAGLSVSRTQLHVDTDKASDFSIETPSPGADVPHVALDAEISISEPAGILIIPLFLTFITIPVLRRRR